MSDCFYIVRSIFDTSLKVAVAAVASKLVIAPFSRKKPKRLVSLCESWQSGIVWFEELPKPLVTSFTFESANG